MGRFVFDNTPFDFSDSLNEDKCKKPSKREKEIKNVRSEKCIEIRNKIFDVLHENGFKTTNESFGNGYFIFDLGDNSVAHFDIKGFWTGDYRFGIWIHPQYFEDSVYNKYVKKYKKSPAVVEIFAQHKDCIDKFKPSASFICRELNRCDFDDKHRNILKYYVCGLVNNIRFHPVISYLEMNANRNMNRFPIIHFIRSRFSHKYNKLKTLFYEKIIFKIYMVKFWLLSKSKCIDTITIEDFEAKYCGGLTTSYKYNIKLKFSKESTEDEIDSFMKKMKKTYFENYSSWQSLFETNQNVQKISKKFKNGKERLKNIWYNYV